MCAGRLRGRPAIPASKENLMGLFDEVMAVTGLGVQLSPASMRGSLRDHRVRRKSAGRRPLGTTTDVPVERPRGPNELLGGEGSKLADALSSEQTYFSRRITSPWPTSWSFSHRRYLYVKNKSAQKRAHRQVLTPP